MIDPFHDKSTVRAQARRGLVAIGAEGADDLDRIPDFPRSSEACDRLASRREWSGAAVVLVTPDTPLNRARRIALREGKRVFQVVPAMGRGEWIVDVTEVDAPPDSLAGPAGVTWFVRRGTPTPVERLPFVDLVVGGSLAAGADGARVGKGAGYLDIEHAILFEVGAITATTSMCTVRDGSCVFEAGTIPQREHDVPLDLIVAPTRSIECATAPFDAGVKRGVWSTDRAERIPGLRSFLEQTDVERTGVDPTDGGSAAAE